MNHEPLLAVVECGHCGMPAYVGAGGIACYCTPGMSAIEHHQDDAERAQKRIRIATEREALKRAVRALSARGAA